MHRHSILLIFIVITACTVRFYNLTWGNGSYFHPDENNMARAITQLSPEKGLHPGFFAYGQAPLYIAYGSGVISNAIQAVANKSVEADLNLTQVSFPTAIFWLRFWSALFSLATVFITYRISLTIASKPFSLITALLITFIPGLIQFSRFGTTESALSLLLCLIVFLSIKFSQNMSTKNQVQKAYKSSTRVMLLLGLAFGFSVGLKLSSAYFIIPIIASFLLILTYHRGNVIRVSLVLCAVFILTSLIGYVIASPYNIVDVNGFTGSMHYELAVSEGLPVFYTRQFMDTVPYVFHLQNIFPYALGWPLFLVSIISIIYAVVAILYAIYKNNYAKNIALHHVTILLISVIGYIAAYGHYFIKWSRIMTPALPLMTIMTSYTLYKFYTYIRERFPRVVSRYASVSITLLIVACCIPGIRFFQLYLMPDTRYAVSKWIYDYIPDGSYILSETANVVDIPVEVADKTIPDTVATHDYTVISFNFYELEDVPGKEQELLDELVKADYIFVPSRRIFMNHLRFPETYPTATKYYTALFNGTLGFENLYTQYPTIPVPLMNTPYLDDEHAEESWSVFDHPVIRIYHKTTPKTRQEYGTILNI